MLEEGRCLSLTMPSGGGGSPLLVLLHGHQISTLKGGMELLSVGTREACSFQADILSP